MANRFKTNHDVVDFNDPTVLTVVPAEVKAEVPEVKPVEEKPQAETKAEPKKVVKKETREKKPVASGSSVLDDIMMDNKTKKSYGFYLDDDIVQLLEDTAKEKNTNRSKILNALLRKVLFDE